MKGPVQIGRLQRGQLLLLLTQYGFFAGLAGFFGLLELPVFSAC
jgi:hypothetical protein